MGIFIYFNIWALIPLAVTSDLSTEWKNVDNYEVTRRWSLEGESMCQDTGLCCPDSACVIPENELWVIDADMDVGTLEIEGFLKWDENVDDVTLSTNFILVKSLGQFQMVTDNKAEIFIKKPKDGWHPISGDQTGFGYHADFGSRFFVGDARNVFFRKKTVPFISQAFRFESGHIAKMQNGLFVLWLELYFWG